MRPQLLEGKPSSRDRDRARVNRFAASDVVRGVANDVNCRGLELDSMFFARPLTRKNAELIAIVVIVGEGAEFEELPKTIMFELEFGAPLHVSRQQTNYNLRDLLQSAQQFFDSRQNATRATRKRVGKVSNVLFQESGCPLFVRLNLCLAQDLVNDAAVRASGNFDSVEIVPPAKLLLEYAMQCFYARARGIDQRAINVEKQEAFRGCRIQAGDFKLRRRLFKSKSAFWTN